MRQISIAPSGLNPHEVITNIAITGERFIFASTLAVYVYDLSTFSVEKVITLSDRTITSFSLSPHDNNLLMIGTLGGKLYLWDIDQQKLLNSLISDNFRVRCAIVLWDSHQRDAVYSFAQGQPSGKLMYWNQVTASNPTMLVFSELSSPTSKLTVAKLNPHTPKLVAVGIDDGSVQVLEVGASVKSTGNGTGHKTLKQQTQEGPDSVVDMAWDCLSSIYLLVAYQEAGMILWDAESATQIHVFDKQAAAGITSIAWMEWAMGSFVTTNAKNSSLKVWNASQKLPLDTIKVEGGDDSGSKQGPAGRMMSGAGHGDDEANGKSKQGILQLGRKGGGDKDGDGLLAASINSETRCGVCAHTDGRLSVYNLHEKVLLFRTNPGHQETIFDTEFCPTDPDTFATCSYDATIKIWNVATFSLKKTLKGASICIYSLAWSPTGKMIGGSCANGEVCVWNVATGVVVSRYSHHNGAASFCLTWNRLNPNTLCSSSSNATMVIFQVKEETLVDSSRVVLGNYKVEKGREGHMSGSLKNLHSAEKMARDKQSVTVDASDIKMRVSLPAPIFGVDFSPFMPNLVLAASQDGIVRLFDYYNQNPLVCVMKGHTGRVFQVKWNPLDESTFASGSDDGTVKVWRVPVQYLDSQNSDTGRLVDSSPGKHLDGRSQSAQVDLRSKTNIPVLTMSTLLSGTSKDDNSKNLPVFMHVRDLKGHRSNVRALSWNHELKNVLLSGSWDATIRVWDVLSGNCIQKVVAHVADVYALSVHPDRPFTYLSVSRDNTIRMWELGRAGDLRGCFAQSVWEAGLDTARSDDIDEPQGKLFGGVRKSAEANPNVSNPATPVKPPKPSRLGGNATPADAQSIASDSSGDSSAGSSTSTQKAEPSMTSKSALYRMMGARSLELLEEIKSMGSGSEGNSTSSGKLSVPIPHKAWTVQERLALAKKYYRLFNFFCGGNGCLDVWEAALALLEAESEGTAADGSHALSRSLLLRDPSCRQIATQGEIIAQAQTTALRVTRLGSGAASAQSKNGVSERAAREIRKAADAHVRVGEYREYCRLMVQLGDYSSALAIAPCVGMDYWRELAGDYANSLRSRGNELCAPFYLATGAPHRATDFYLERRDISNALVAASTAEKAQEPAFIADKPSSAGPTRGAQSSVRTPQRALSVTGNLSTLSHMYLGEDEHTSSNNRAKPLTRAVNAATADILIGSGHPILAAAQHLSCGEVDLAVNVLVGCDEYELAFAIVVVFQRDSSKVRMLWSHQVQEKFNNTTLSLKILSSLPAEAEKEKCLLISTRCSTQSVLKEAFLLYGVRPIMSWNTYAGEQEILGKDENIIAPLVLTLQHEKAVTKGLAYLKAYVRDPLELPAVAVSAYNSLKFVRATTLAPALRTSFLMHMLWFGAHEAAAQGLWDTAADMLRILLAWTKKVAFPVSPGDTRMQGTIFRVMAVPTFGDNRAAFEKAIAALDAQIDDNKSSGGTSEVAQVLNTLRDLVTKKFQHKAGICKSADRHDGGLSEAEISGGLYACEMRDATVKLSSLLALPSLQRLPYFRPCNGGMSVMPGSMLPFFAIAESPLPTAGGATQNNAPRGMEASMMALAVGVGHHSCISGDIIKRQSLRMYSTVASPAAAAKENSNNNNGGVGGSTAAQTTPGGSKSSVRELIEMDEAKKESENRNRGQGGCSGDDVWCFAGLNEVLGWRRVNPFSPTMTGEWLADVVEPTLI